MDDAFLSITETTCRSDIGGGIVEALNSIIKRNLLVYLKIKKMSFHLFVHTNYYYADAYFLSS